MLYSHRLSNGITTYYYPIPHAYSTAIGWFIKCGSRNERKSQNGISHLLEHMQFYTDQSDTSLPIFQKCDNIGSNLRGTTGTDYTSYIMKFAPQYLMQALLILKEILADHEWTEKQLEREKKIIQCEMQESDLWYERQTGKTYWKKHPLGFNVLGTEKKVKQMQIPDLLAFKHAYYSQGNIAFAASGKFREADMMQMNAILEQIRLPESSATSLAAPLCGCRKPDVKLLSTSEELLEVKLCFDIDLQKISNACTALLSHALGEKSTALLPRQIREKMGVTYDINTYLCTHIDCAQFCIEYCTAKQTFLPSFKAVLKVLDCSSSCLSAQHLAKNNPFFTDNIWFWLEEPDSWIDYLVWQNFFQNQSMVSVEQEITAFCAVSVTELQSAAKTIFQPENAAVIICGDISDLSKKQIRKLIISELNS